MLGLTSSTESPDDIVTLKDRYNWSYGQDVTNTVEHEISEGGMGRIGGLGDQNGSWSVMESIPYNSRERRTTATVVMDRRPIFPTTAASHSRVFYSTTNSIRIVSKSIAAMLRILFSKTFLELARQAKPTLCHRPIFR